jgi:hypothetical protein
VLLNFTRAALQCHSYHALARQLILAIGEFGLKCSLMIRHGGETTVRTSAGPASPLELSILENASTMGRIFQVGGQCVFNYDHVSIVVRGLPEDEEQRGRIRDNLTILAETAEGLCDNVRMRQESIERARQLQLALNGAAGSIDQMRQRQQRTLVDTRLLLQDMIDTIERAYGWLDTAPDQEREISATMDGAVQRVLTLLYESSERHEADCSHILAALRNREAEPHEETGSAA